MMPLMDALSFLEKHGKEVAERVATAAGTNYAYFSQIAYGHRRPSVDLAQKLVASSTLEFAEAADQLDFQSLLVPKQRAASPLAPTRKKVAHG
jgi:hypothetical protein